ncbi:cytosine permease [Fusibacter ferrireducens]|uniref:Cytosine permease n=1 Tax=Fusibacter ferrireducens TaxID=2785058 RepID=A0ABR9ZSP0_9FIRM|nr:cytosine permease [Fusibacter ferrireducens]MBF4693366.1 cytosine permease [Fusibacter ferrireducens]
MAKKLTGFEVKPEEKQNWQSIAMVWIGSMICVPSLMIGGLVGSSMSIGKVIMAILIGYSIICIYMSLIGIQGCDTGLPTAVMASGALGKKGAQYVISSVLAIACIGWFGIQSAVCGTSFSSMLATMTGITIPTWLSSTLWGIIMLVTACYGFKGLKWLNFVAVPLLLIVCGYGVWAAMVQFNGLEVMANYVTPHPMPFVTGISLVVATFAVGGAISSDYCRFAKSRKDVIKSSVLGVLPAGLTMLLIGAVMSIVTGQYDISAVLTAVGVPAIGLVALVLATWTTNVTNAYSGGLSLSNLLGLDESYYKVTTAIAGGIGTLLAALGLLGKFTAFLTLLSALVPALVGVLIADYWLIGKGDPKAFKLREGVFAPGMISFLVGALVACITGGTFASFPSLVAAFPILNMPFFIGPINGIVVSMLLYIAIVKVIPGPNPSYNEN